MTAQRHPPAARTPSVVPSQSRSSSIATHGPSAELLVIHPPVTRSAVSRFVQLDDRCDVEFAVPTTVVQAEELCREGGQRQGRSGSGGQVPEEFEVLDHGPYLSHRSEVP